MSAAMQEIEERLPALSFQERLLLIEHLAQDDARGRRLRRILAGRVGGYWG